MDDKAKDSHEDMLDHPGVLAVVGAMQPNRDDPTDEEAVRAVAQANLQVYASWPDEADMLDELMVGNG
ncbi:hypothetical protein [Magnetofaba australis]|uniref:hypothetical protein n=1 Tax=Magnetofaba australis TaxID=1472297 RepID=UPI000A19C60B|nr:hypothetical protein [Magnetofaba australis]